jgi:hypothetical protein
MTGVLADKVLPVTGRNCARWTDSGQAVDGGRTG